MLGFGGLGALSVAPITYRLAELTPQLVGITHKTVGNRGYRVYRLTDLKGL